MLVAPYCRVLAATAVGLLLGAGCAGPRETQVSPSRLPADSEGQAIIERGEPHPTLDRLERFVDLPTKILPFGPAQKRAREPAPETTDRLATYLEQNGLTDVHVYVHHYDPAGQWQRLRQNQRISPVLKYSLGTLSLVGYTVFPRRVLGGHEYNPYTNSLLVNSDARALILQQAARAKDLHARRYPGLYACVTKLPFGSLAPQYKSMQEVVASARAQGDWELEREAYRVLYPQMGREFSSSITSPVVLVERANLLSGMGPVVAVGPLLGLGGSAVGHRLGKQAAERRALELHQQALEELPPTSEVMPASYEEPVDPVTRLPPP